MAAWGWKPRHSRMDVSTMKKNLLLLSIVILLVSCTTLPQNDNLTTPVTAVSMVHRNVEQNTLGFKEDWRKSTLIPTPNNFTVPNLFIVNDQIVYSEYRMLDKTTDENWLVSIRLANGTEVWRTKLQGKFGAYITGSLLDLQLNRLFLLYSFRVHTFALDTGDLIWESKELGQHRTHVFIPGNTHPLKINSTENEIIDIDPSNGRILQQTKTTLANGYTIQYKQILFTTTSDALIAKNVETGQTLWEYGDPHGIGKINLWPIFLNTDMIYQSGNVIYKIRRVNVTTGKAIWETGEEYISNIVIDGDRLYAINDKGSIVAIDITNGQVLGKISFDRVPENLGGDPFWVITNNSHLIVLFGDEPEIISFRK